MASILITILSFKKCDLPILSTCDTEHLQADKWFEERSSKGAKVIPAEVQQGQRWQARQGMLCKHLNAVLLQVKLLQSLQMEERHKGEEDKKQDKQVQIQGDTELSNADGRIICSTLSLSNKDQKAMLSKREFALSI